MLTIMVSHPSSAVSNQRTDMEESIINLADYLPEGEKVLSEWEEGKRVGEETAINKRIVALGQSDYVTVRLPEQIRYVSPAFLEGFLSEAIREYGRSGLLRRVKFTEATQYDISDNLEEAIDRTLTEQNALWSASALS